MQSGQAVPVSSDMKLYTKQGDDGKTSLFGGQRVGKDSPRVESYGMVDELNAALGLASTASDQEEISQVLAALQNQLFDLGAVLCTPPDTSPKHIKPITAAHIMEIEQVIDRVCAPLPPLKNFILPGGCELAARLHLARCICRRAERAIVGLSHRERVAPEVVVWINRLSDLLFALARRANQLAGVEDVIWSA